MKLTHALLGEHGLFSPLLDSLESAIDTAPSPDVLRAVCEPIAIAIETHARLEDELLFAAFRDRLGDLGPGDIMRREHQEIDALIASIRGGKGDVRANVVELIDLAREHFRKEEEMLFPFAETSLDERTLEALGAQWAKLRGVDL